MTVVSVLSFDREVWFTVTYCSFNVWLYVPFLSRFFVQGHALCFFSFPTELLKHQWQTSDCGVSQSESESPGLISNLTILQRHSIIKQGEIHQRRSAETHFSTNTRPQRRHTAIYIEYIYIYCHILCWSKVFLPLILFTNTNTCK